MHHMMQPKRMIWILFIFIFSFVATGCAYDVGPMVEDPLVDAPEYRVFDDDDDTQLQRIDWDRVIVDSDDVDDIEPAEVFDPQFKVEDSIEDREIFCDGIDDDGDERIDEGYPIVCGSCDSTTLNFCRASHKENLVNKMRTSLRNAILNTCNQCMDERVLLFD